MFYLALNLPKTKPMAASKYIGVFLMITTLLLVGCDDKDEPNAFEEGKGMKGKIHVQNEFAQPLYDERAGIKVHFEVGYREFDVVADAQGNWQLDAAPAGTYTITFSKEGYGTMVMHDVKLSYTHPVYPADNLFQKLPSVTLTKLPNTQFSDFDLSINILNPGGNEPLSYELEITGKMIPAPPPNGSSKGYRIFIGDDENVSNENYIFQAYFNSITAEFEHVYPNSWFKDNEVNSGDVIHAVIYGDASFDEWYEDEEGNKVFPNLTPEPGAYATTVLP